MFKVDKRDYIILKKKMSCLLLDLFNTILNILKFCAI